MGIHSGPTVWRVTCDHKGCLAEYAQIAATSTQALMQAADHDWQTRYDGTALCPKHRQEHHGR